MSKPQLSVRSKLLLAWLPKERSIFVVASSPMAGLRRLCLATLPACLSNTSSWSSSSTQEPPSAQQPAVGSSVTSALHSSRQRRGSLLVPASYCSWAPARTKWPLVCSVGGLGARARRFRSQPAAGSFNVKMNSPRTHAMRSSCKLPSSSETRPRRCSAPHSNAGRFLVFAPSPAAAIQLWGSYSVAH